MISLGEKSRTIPGFPEEGPPLVSMWPLSPGPWLPKQTSLSRRGSFADQAEEALYS